MRKNEITRGALFFDFLISTVIFISISDLLKEILSVAKKIKFGGIVIIGMILIILFSLIPGRRS